MKIVRFELENVKKVRLARIAPAESGLTVIGGKNHSGKTSILDGIIYALGGEKYRPTALQNDEGVTPARISIELDGGLLVERKGKNAALKVTDKTGKKFGQKLLDSFCEQLALNLPRFLVMKDEEKAAVLLKTLGIDAKLAEIDKREQAAYNRRHDYGVIADQKMKFAREAREYPEAGTELVDVNDLAKQAAEIAERNAKRAAERQKVKAAQERAAAISMKIDAITAEVEALRREALDVDKQARTVVPEDEDASEILQRIKEAEMTNSKVRQNLDKELAVQEAERCKAEYEELTADVERIRAERDNLLFGTAMPLPELTIGKNAAGKPILLYNGKAWDCTSTSEQYRIAVAVVQKLKPECKFVLLDRMESFDSGELEKFDAWLAEQGLQAICTRVGSDDASILIEDGYCVDDAVAPFAEAATENITASSADAVPGSAPARKSSPEQEPDEAPGELDW